MTSDPSEPPDPVKIALERQESHALVQQLHPGNRFRKMFGLPLLPQPDYGPIPKEFTDHESKQ